MTEVEQLLELLKQGKPMAAMLAPSFPIVYDAPAIVGKLKRLGFAYVLEVSAGAQRTNEAVIKALRTDPKSRWITSPCPSFVRLVRTKYPQLKPFLAFAADSPMVATARIVKEKYPEAKPVFIGPCNAKKLEANEDYPDLNILALTFKDLDSVFATLGVIDDPLDTLASFDVSGTLTRLYPISGGLAQSSEVRKLLSEDQIDVVSGWQNHDVALARFQAPDSKVRLLDILFCEGGCINGPGMASPLSLDWRRAKIIAYWRRNGN